MSCGRTVIVKLAERCNLACPYCYMYSGPDQSWRTRPRRLSPGLVQTLVDRAGELLEAQPDVHLTLEFHGGEPLLFGRDRFADLMGRLHERLPRQRVTYCLQTNGVLLDAEWCAFFAANQVHWSISMDGPAETHDRYRVRRNGKGSHAEVAAAIRLSQSRPEWKRWFGGVLAVIDPQADGAAIVRYFRELGVAHLDLLMPDATHVAAPSHLPDFSQRQLLRFLSEAFDAWVALDDRSFHIRTFEHIALGIFGRPPELDAFGAGLDWLMVVETDGSYQLLDVLHICGEQFTHTGGALQTRSFSEQFAWQQDRRIPPCAVCLECPVYDLCGGGYLPHRFDGAGFDKPSVHCESLYGLTLRIQEFLRSQLPSDVWEPRVRKAVVSQAG